MDTARIGKILKSKKVHFRLELKTGNQIVVADNSNTMKAQIVGDLQISIR